jgi:hypothetical protein
MIRTNEVIAMSPSICDQTDERGVDLGTGVDRRRLVAAVSLGLVVLSAGVLMALLAGTQDARDDEPVVAQRVAPPRERASDLPALPKAPVRPREAARQEPLEKAPEKPALPEAPAPKPEIVVAKSVPKPTPRVVVSPSAPPEPEEVVKTLAPPSFKRRSRHNETELQMQLTEESRELDVEAEEGTTRKLLADVKDALSKDEARAAGTDKSIGKTAPTNPAILDLIAQRADLKGLPVRNIGECQASERETKEMQVVSAKTRKDVGRFLRREDSETSASQSLGRDSYLVGYLEKAAKGTGWSEEAWVRMLVQIFRVESAAVRLQVIKTLAAIKGNGAGAALAQWAAFDLNPDVREAAAKALTDRPRAEYATVLLEALRYPWPPVADHAAEAFVALKDRQAAFDLARILDEPDPSAPTQTKDNIWVVPEIVRVNHLANCVLCHSPSCDKKDPMRGLVPERGKELPVVYYESRSGDFIRADVTYLKQDFSVLQPVSKPDKWPRLQRFDYLIRMRELSNGESVRPAATINSETQPTYPQREAVLWALRELTGEDKGTRSDRWFEYLKEARSEEKKSQKAPNSFLSLGALFSR